MPRRIVQQDDDINRAGANEGLTSGGARISGLDRIEHVRHSESRRRQRLRNQMNRNRRRPALTLELQIYDAFHLAERGGHFVGCFVEGVEVISEYLDGHLSGFAAQALADAVAQERDHFALDAGVLLQDFAQLILCDDLIDRGIRFQLNVELTAMRAPGILAQLGTPYLLLDALHVRQREHFLADALADVQHLIEGRAGYRARDLHDKVAFAKVRHECAAQKWERRRRPDHQNEQYHQRDFEVNKRGLHTAT